MDGSFFKSVFCILFVSSILLAWGNCRKVTLDFDGDIESHGFYYDHLERIRYFRTIEEMLLGSLSPAMNITSDPLGVWLYESYGIGGCCGGLMELTTNGIYNRGDNVEVLIRYFTNVNMTVYPDIIGNTRTIIPPPGVSPINWTTKIFRVNTTTTSLLRFSTNFGVNQAGYFLLDKLVLGIGESVFP